MAREVYNIASSGLLLAQRALNTTSRNISNSNVEGYSRQRLESDGIPEVERNQGQGSKGNIAGTVTRSFDFFVESQIRTESAAVNATDVYHQLASSIDNVVADPDTNLGSPMSELFSALQGIVTDPSSSAARIDTLDRAEVMTQRFGTLNDQLNTLHDQVNSELKTSVDEINTLAKNIASLNTQIVAASNLANTSLPNDLMDQRDVMLQHLSEKIDTKVSVGEGGYLSVFVGYGQPLVSGGSYSQLEVTNSDYDPNNKNVMLIRDNVAPSNITDTISGGHMGGVLRFNKEVLNPTQNYLGQMAAGFALAFNAQNSAGIDLNGNAGGNLFTDFTKTLNTKDNWHENTGNTSVAKLDVSFDNSTDNNYRNLVASDYNLVFKEGSYTLTRLSDKTTFPPSTDGTFNVDGLNIKLRQDSDPPVLPADGDSYLITPFAHVASDIQVTVKDGSKIAAASPGGSGAADNTNIFALSKLQTVASLANGKYTFQEVYSGMVTWVGGKTRNADIDNQAHQTLLKQMNDQRQSISGVNLDEEASSLLQYQQAYQAAARIIPIANSMFDALLSAVR